MIAFIKQHREVCGIESETRKWVDGFNNRRLLEPIRYIIPTEADEAFCADMNTVGKTF